MHFEVLVEDLSGKKALDILVPRIIGETNTCKIIEYKGIGHIPKGLSPKHDPKKRILLDQLPRLLQGYGRTFSNPSTFAAAVIVVCDLDDRCLRSFRREPDDILDRCKPKPVARFCIAVEELEAWFLGDLPAIRSVYPGAKHTVLQGYENDSICGTWEKLADAVYKGGACALSGHGRQKIGEEKSRWAERISPHMDVKNSRSPSFVYFREKLIELAKSEV